MNRIYRICEALLGPDTCEVSVGAVLQPVTLTVCTSPARTQLEKTGTDY